MVYFIKNGEKTENTQSQPIAHMKSEFAFNLVKMCKKVIEKYRNCKLTSITSTAILQFKNNRLRNIAKQDAIINHT